MRTTTLNAIEYYERHAMMEEYNAVGSVDAGRVAMVHLKSKRGWAYRPEPEDVFDFINAQPEIDKLPEVGIVFARAGANRVRLFSRDGQALIERKREGDKVKYRIAEYQANPLDYRHVSRLKPYIDGQWYSSREWLIATADMQFPDVVPQCVEMFDSPRSADIVIMASEKSQLYPREVGGHGSCMARDMHCMMYFSGPGIPKDRMIRQARIVDLMPTILGLLGQEHRLNNVVSMDGINLASSILSAKR